MDDLLLLPATLLREKLLARALSCVELTRLSLARIEAANPTVNALVALDPEAALAAAAEFDARIARARRARWRASRQRQGRLQRRRLSPPASARRLCAIAGPKATRPPSRDCARRARSSSESRTRRCSPVISRPTTRSTERPIIRSIPPFRPAVLRAARRRRSPPACLRSNSGPILAVRCAGRPMPAASLATSRAGASSRRMAPSRLRPKTLLRDADCLVAGPLARSAADLAAMLDVVAGPRVGPRRPPWFRRGGSTRAGLRVALWASDPFAPADASVRAAVV